jgi:hypothetical protein
MIAKSDDNNNKPKYELMTPEEIAAACEHLLMPIMHWIRTLCEKIASSLSWEERAEQIITETNEWTQVCRERARSLEDARLQRFVITMHIAGLRELYHGGYYELRPAEDSYREHLGRVARAFKALLQAVGERSEDDSPQSKYAEARLSARRVLGEQKGPDLLEGFDTLTDFVKERSNTQVYEYTASEVHLNVDDFFEAIHMIARDKAEAAEIPNPPARVRTAITRKRRRQKWLERKRTVELPEAETLKDEPDLEKDAIVKTDFERAIGGLGLSFEQGRLLEAEMNGLKLQESGAAEYLGWDRKRFEKVRRSLQADRAAGKRLRARLADYAPARSVRG